MALGGPPRNHKNLAANAIFTPVPGRGFLRSSLLCRSAGQEEELRLMVSSTVPHTSGSTRCSNTTKQAWAKSPLSSWALRKMSYSANLVEGEFCELCIDGVLGSSAQVGGWWVSDATHFGPFCVLRSPRRVAPPAMCGKNLACPGAPFLLSLSPNGYAPQRGVHRVLSSEGHRSGGDRDAMGHEDGHEVPRANAPALQRLHARLSECSIELRFFGPLGELSEEMADRLTHADDARTDTQPRAAR